ncbi:MAG: radical SAM protein [Proteobacteria bacterium]|nr:radical SAM protein [Pseudomonadota bacterium]
MELPRRKGQDALLPDGEMIRAMVSLAERADLHDLRIGIVYAFDRRAYMMPYLFAHNTVVPLSVRMVCGALYASGFKHQRIILQQWTPNFKPSKAILDGRPLDMLLISAMQVHGESAYQLIREAHTMGPNRPLILAGGPKAIYEPTDLLEMGPRPGIGADCVVTGEAYVLLRLIEVLSRYFKPGTSALDAFETARKNGDLEEVLGLVYMAPDSASSKPYALNTGVQRLVRDLDECPMPVVGYSLLEPKHRRETLSAGPLPAKKVGKMAPVGTVVSTQGCRFNCNYCPIPAYNQRTWRHKSPQRLADELAYLYENFGIADFFGTDDNFFNKRQTVIELMTATANRKLSDGSMLGERIRFYTEATEYDVFKNIDILPLCKRGGLSAIWFGIEDITATLVNKGQTIGKTEALFREMHKAGIAPAAMMIHSDDQPLRSPKGDLTGLLNQAKYMFDHGAWYYQCTYLQPAVGTRSYEDMKKEGMLFKSVDGVDIPAAYYDGSRVISSKSKEPWKRQLEVIYAYAAFYNPLNTLRVIKDWRKSPHSSFRLLLQILGQVGLIHSAPKLWQWSRKLKRGRIERMPTKTRARIPMIDVLTREEVFWADERLPSPVSPASQPHANRRATESISLNVLPS